MKFIYENKDFTLPILILITSILIRLLVYRWKNEEFVESWQSLGSEFCLLGLSTFFAALLDPNSVILTSTKDPSELAVSVAVFLMFFVVAYALATFIQKHLKANTPKRDPFSILRNRTLVGLWILSWFLGGISFILSLGLL